MARAAGERAWHAPLAWRDPGDGRDGGVPVEEEDVTMNEPLLTISEVSKALTLSKAFVRRRMVTGEWPSYRFGRSRRMARADVDAILAAARQGSVVCPAGTGPDALAWDQ